MNNQVESKEYKDRNDSSRNVTASSLGTSKFLDMLLQTQKKSEG